MKSCRKYILMIVSLTLLAGTLALSGFGAAQAGSETAEAEAEAHGLGYLPEDLSSAEPIAVSLLPGNGVTNAADGINGSDLPSSYSAVTEGLVNPAAKDQGIYGTCWAQAITTCAETTYKKNENITDGFPSLSVLQEVAFCYASPNDPLGNASSDSVTPIDPESDSDSVLYEGVMDRGGNVTYTMLSLSAWDNGASEDTLPYTEEYIAQVIGKTLSSAYNYDYDEAHVRNVKLLNTSECTVSEKTAAVKQLVLEYGAVTTSYGYYTKVYDSIGGEYVSVNYENGTYGSYYCNIAKSANHMVTIVGWNDDYPASQFGLASDSGTMPEADGAWLCLNSWGCYENSTDSDEDPADSGAQGYFWLSYYDMSQENLFGVFDFESADTYQYNYMYDGTLTTGYYYTVSGSNGRSAGALYTVKGLTAGHEKVSGVSFITSSANVSGTVTVIPDTTADAPLDTEGKEVCTVSFTADYPGLYTIPVDGPVLEKGQSYTVLITPDQSSSIRLSIDYLASGSVSDLMINVPDSTNDLTFLSTAAGKVSWLHTASCPATLRIKGFTNDVYTVSYDANGGSGVPESQTKGRKESILLTVPGDSEEPVLEGHLFLGWSTDRNALTAEFRPGDSFSADADTTLYAVWDEPLVEQAREKIADLAGALYDGEEVLYTEAAWNALREAREAYEALTEREKEKIPAEELEELLEAEAAYAEKEKGQASYTVAVQSRVSGTDQSLVTMTGGGSCYQYRGAVLTAPEAPEGYEFKGWFIGYSEAADGVPAADELCRVLEVHPSEEALYTAVYEEAAGAEELCITVQCASFRVKAGVEETDYAPESGSGVITAARGTEITLTFTDTEAEFLCFTDGNGNVLGTGISCTFTAVRDLTVKAVTSANEENGSSAIAKVVFLNKDGSVSGYTASGVLSAKLMGNCETIVFPDAGDGYRFSMSAKQIRAAMGSSSVIFVKSEASP